MLPDKINKSVCIASSFMGNALDKRIAMLEVKEVMDVLSVAEKNAFLSSTKTPIREYDQRTLIEKVSKLSEMLSKDLGIKSEIGQYEKTRFFDILSKYYSDLTLGEIKNAFDMSLIGELDMYLPKNGNGEPDKGHYQSFSVEYVTKILNAYRKKRDSFISKAFNALPIPEKKINNQELLIIKRQTFLKNKMKYLLYKYTGSFEITGIEEKIIYEKLLNNGLAYEIKVASIDKHNAYREVLLDYSKAFKNKYDLNSIEKSGVKHETVKNRAYRNAVRNEIKRVFDYLISEEIEIDRYLI